MSSKSFRVTAESPTRIDLAGGTLDLWPMHYLLKKAATLNVAVTVPASVDISASGDGTYHIQSLDQKLTVSGKFADVIESKSLPLVGKVLRTFWSEDLPPLRIQTNAKSPAGAGLGGSSCLAVTVGGALWKLRLSQFGQTGFFAAFDEHKLVKTCQDIEAQLIHAPTGIQDYWGAVRGGVNVIRFPFGYTEVTTRPPSSLGKLTEELILCYSGKSRASATNNWEVFKRAFERDEKVLGILETIGELTEKAILMAERGDLAATLKISAEEWAQRKSLWPDITTEETERIDAAAIKAGALFTRVCGAGGGGVMAVFAPQEKHRAVKDAMTKVGGTILEGGASEKGLTIKLH